MRPETLSHIKSAVWFVAKLNALAVPLYLAVYLNVTWPAFQDAWAAGLSQSLGSLGYETALSGHTIGVRSGQTLYQIDLSWDSTGWKSLYAMSALVFASGAGSLGQKLRFLAFALPLVAFLNLLRVVTTSLVYLNYGLPGFELVHGLLWSAVMVVLVVFLWYWLFLKEKR